MRLKIKNLWNHHLAMDGTSVKNHEKSFHLLEMCDFFLTFSDDFLKISIHPHHFGAFGQYPSSPKLKGAKNFLKKENIEKVPPCFSQISLLHLEGWFFSLVTKINHDSTGLLQPTASWWNPPYLDSPRDPGGKGLPWPYSKRWWPPKRPCLFCRLVLQVFLRFGERGATKKKNSYFPL